MAKSRKITLQHCEPKTLKPKPGGTANPKILNISTDADGGGNVTGGTITVTNGGGPSNGGTTATSDPIAVNQANFDDAFSVDVSRGVTLHFVSEPAGSSIEISYEYE